MSWRQARSYRASQYLPKEQTASLTIPSGTAGGQERTLLVSPPEGYFFAIRYFKLTTPAEVKGNIILIGMDGVETKLLASDQNANLSDQQYNASDWDPEFLYLAGFKVYGLTTTQLTADRTVTVKYSGGLVR
ncbi:MAG: hypothetical protein QW491_09495 [Thermoproteota archaeon]